MPKINDKPLTRAQQWRNTIILLEIMVLLAAVFFNVTQPAPTAEVLEVNTLPDKHMITVYVDSFYRLFIMDNGVAQEYVQFRVCPNRRVTITHTGDLPNYAETNLTWADDIAAATFTSGDYYVVNTSTDLSLFFENGASLTVALDCNVVDVTPMMVYVTDNVITIADYENNQRLGVLMMSSACDLVWDMGQGQHRASLDEMAYPENDSGWLPSGSVVAFRFDVVGDYRLEKIYVDDEPSIAITHEGGVLVMYTDCSGGALNELLNQAEQQTPDPLDASLQGIENVRPCRHGAYR